jgi:two-component system, NarL family, nitrate/nitrite response regulator NarL
MRRPNSAQAANRRLPEKSKRAPVRLAIATQPTLFRDALSRLLSGQKNLQVVGQCWNEDQIADVLIRQSPQVLLFDYEALGPSSEGIILRLRRVGPKTRILVMATRSGDETVERVLRAGASGLVGKQLDLDTLLRAIRVVAAGEVWANRRTTARALTQLTDFPERAGIGDRRLTKREQQIVDGVTRGLRNKEIARLLGISEKTVKSHLSNIFQKLGLDGRFALALFEQRPVQS